MPCLMPPVLLAAARSEGWHLPEKIIIIICILCIIVKEQKSASLHFHTQFIPAIGIEPRSTATLDEGPTARPLLRI
jgi:hypothetical protein